MFLTFANFDTDSSTTFIENLVFLHYKQLYRKFVKDNLTTKKAKNWLKLKSFSDFGLGRCKIQILQGVLFKKIKIRCKMMQLEYSTHLKSIIAHATISMQNQTNVLKRIDILSAKSKYNLVFCA